MSGNGFVGWAGGLDFARSCVEGLRAALGADGAVSFVAPRSGEREEPSARRLARDARLAVRRMLRRPVHPRPPPFTECQIIETVWPQENGREVRFHRPGFRSMAHALREAGADAVLPAMILPPRRFPIPWVGYLADCQHRHLPELFTGDDRTSRDRLFRNMLARASAVVVNAAAVRDDIARFYGEGHAKVIALPFSASAPDAWLDADPGDVCERYGVGRRYFIVCNQFWKHKDHATAFRALARAQEAGLPPDVALVCTGKVEDQRDPRYADEIRRTIAELGLGSSVKLLGFLPKLEQVLLLKRSLAVVQPTRFEGGPGGGAAYDALSLGVPLLASDIPVNRELPPERVTFFRAGDDAALGELLVRAAGAPIEPVPRALLRERGDARRRELGEVLLAAARIAIEGGEK